MFFGAENFCNKSTHSHTVLRGEEGEGEGERVGERKIELLMPKSKVVRFKFCSTFNIQLKVTKTQPTLSLLSFLSAHSSFCILLCTSFLMLFHIVNSVLFFLLHEFVAKQRMLLA